VRHQQWCEGWVARRRVATAVLRDEVDKALQDRTVLAAEAKQATTTQNQHQRDATVWVRGVGKRCQNAMQLGAALPPELAGSAARKPCPPCWNK
jgi:hypothetical protein